MPRSSVQSRSNSNHRSNQVKINQRPSQTPLPYTIEHYIRQDPHRSYNEISCSSSTPGRHKFIDANDSLPKT